MSECPRGQVCVRVGMGTYAFDERHHDVDDHDQANERVLAEYTLNVTKPANGLNPSSEHRPKHPHTLSMMASDEMKCHGSRRTT